MFFSPFFLLLSDYFSDFLGQICNSCFWGRSILGPNSFNPKLIQGTRLLSFASIFLSQWTRCRGRRGRGGGGWRRTNCCSTLSPSSASFHLSPTSTINLEKNIRQTSTSKNLLPSLGCYFVKTQF